MKFENIKPVFYKFYIYIYICKYLMINIYIEREYTFNYFFFETRKKN